MKASVSNQKCSIHAHVASETQSPFPSCIASRTHRTTLVTIKRPLLISAVITATADSGQSPGSPSRGVRRAKLSSDRCKDASCRTNARAEK
eukprot:955554-Pleurochrysis_carterae.AAC.1